MNKVKLIDTGKCKLFAVAMPDYTFNYKVQFLDPYFRIRYDFDKTQSYTSGGFAIFYKDFGGKRKYPKQLEVIGASTELTEDHWRGLVKKGNSYGFWDYNSELVDGLTFFDTAKQSGLSLLEANECFSLNPYSDPELTMKQGNGCVYYGASDEEFEIYEKAQQNTGTWLILKQV